jgi:hypothetical protein
MGQVLALAVGGTIFRIGIDVLDSTINDRPYHFRASVGINDTPETRRCYGDTQKESLQRLIQDKRDEEALRKRREEEQNRANAIAEQNRAYEIAAQKKREEEQIIAAKKKEESIVKLAIGLQQVPKRNYFETVKSDPKTEMARLETTYDKREFSRVEKELREIEQEQSSKLLCPRQVRELATEVLSEVFVEIVSHGNAVSVPSTNSEEFQKFRELLHKKGIKHN